MFSFFDIFSNVNTSQYFRECAQTMAIISKSFPKWTIFAFEKELDEIQFAIFNVLPAVDFPLIKMHLINF